MTYLKYLIYSDGCCWLGRELCLYQSLDNNAASVLYCMFDATYYILYSNNTCNPRAEIDRLLNLLKNIMSKNKATSLVAIHGSGALCVML